MCIHKQSRRIYHTCHWSWSVCTVCTRNVADALPSLKHTYLQENLKAIFPVFKFLLLPCIPAPINQVSLGHASHQPSKTPGFYVCSSATWGVGSLTGVSNWSKLCVSFWNTCGSWSNTFFIQHSLYFLWLHGIAYLFLLYIHRIHLHFLHASRQTSGHLAILLPQLTTPGTC